MNFTLSPSLENFDEQNVQTVHELLSPKEDFIEYDLEEVHVLLIPEEGLVEHDLEAVHALLRVNFRKRIHSEGRTVNVSEISMINIHNYQKQTFCSYLLFRINIFLKYHILFGFSPVQILYDRGNDEIAHVTSS